MILVGDCLEVVRRLDANSVDAIVTDPPYGIGFMGKAWDGKAIVERHAQRDSTEEGRRRNGLASAAGTYDLSPKAMRAFQKFSAAWGAEALRVAKPGAYCVAFASPRTFHRLVCGLEEAGWEIRDTLMWVFGSGFPKGTDKAKIPEGWEGWNTALKPAWEPIVLARKPLDGTVAANLLKHGTGAMNISGCRVETEEDLSGGAYSANGARSVSPALSPTGMNRPGATAGDFVQPIGRWPANLLHDGSDEVVACFPDAPGQMADASASASSRKSQNVYGVMRRGRGDEPSADNANEGAVGFKMKPGARRLDTGSAARFFYCAKASRSDRGEGNTHPTVKPTELMRWLVRLVTPPGGTVLDCFGGSGSTVVATVLEGFDFIYIDKDEDEDGNPLGYADITRARIAAAVQQRAEDLERERLSTSQLGLAL
jgi:site-specific DNA-methyltransferase (adenine-specific)